MIFHALVFGLLQQTGAQSVQNVTEQLTDLDLWCMVPCWQEWHDELSGLVPFKVRSITDRRSQCIRYMFICKKHRGPSLILSRFPMTRDGWGWGGRLRQVRLLQFLLFTDYIQISLFIFVKYRPYHSITNLKMRQTLELHSFPL